MTLTAVQEPTAALEPVAVSEPVAARMLSLSAKTVGRLPAHEVGRFHIGRSVRYLVASVREYAAKIAASQLQAVK